MDVERRLLDSMELENGLTLSFYDLSRPIPGDRLQVRVLAEIHIPVDEALVHQLGDETLTVENMVKALGNPLLYSVMKVKHYVEVEDAVDVIQHLKQELLGASRAYFAHPEFAKKFALRKVEEWKKQDTLHELIKKAGELENRNPAL